MNKQLNISKNHLMKNPVILISILLIAAASGFGLQRVLTISDTHDLPAVLPPTDKSVIGEVRPAFELKDIEGKLRNINEWNGKVLLVNFWATWCSPCKKEIPVFMELQEQYATKGFQVIGLAVDNETAVKDYATTISINYPVMAAEIAAMEISQRYGNQINVIPYTVFVARDGKIVLTRPGEISKKEAEEIIKGLL